MASISLVDSRSGANAKIDCDREDVSSSTLSSSNVSSNAIKRSRVRSEDKELSSPVAPFAESNSSVSFNEMTMSPASPIEEPKLESESDQLRLRTDSKFNSSSDLVRLELNTASRDLSSSSSELEASASSQQSRTVEVPRQSQKFHVKWALATEQGFKRGQNGCKLPIHKEMEDVSWPTAKAMLKLNKLAVTTSEAAQAQVIEIHPESGLSIQVFVLADGHGGSEAPHFLVPRMRNAIVEVMCSKDWSFENEDEREAFEGLVINVFEVLDKEYCQNRIKLFKEWIDVYSKDPNKRPCDDGCTMVVNVLYRDWLVNCNVGDSRTILGSQLCAGAAAGQAIDRPWEVDFTSVDHNISHPVKVYEIHENGGYFVYPGTSLQYFTGIVHPELRNWLPYRETTNLRLYRPLSETVQNVGLSNRRTLNLTATMGDLLFKLAPTILTPRPDVTFIRLSPNRNYSLVIASDGLWDHLSCQSGVHQQNALVMGYVANALASDKAKSKSSSRKPSDASASNIYQAFHSPTLCEGSKSKDGDQFMDSDSESDSDSEYEPYQATSHHHRNAIMSVTPASPIVTKVAVAAVPLVSPNSNVDTSSTLGPPLKSMKRLVQRLARRERNEPSLFARDQPRYDDVTIFVVSVTPEPKALPKSQ